MSNDPQRTSVTSLLDNIITNDDGNDVQEKHLCNLALDIHTRLRLHDTSIIERHMSPFARYNILAMEEPLQTVCAKLSEYTKSGFASLPTRVLALKAICILTVEHPYIRRVWKECNKTCGRLQSLADTSGKPRIKKWAQIALDAIREEDVHQLWSNMITEPINVSDVKRISQSAACDRVDLTELQKTLRHPKTSYLAGLYLKRVQKLAKEGSSEHAIEIIGGHFRLAQQCGGARADTSALKNLCMKLLKYARYPSTAVAAMERIVTLTIENPPVRKIFKESKETRDTLRNIANSQPEHREYAIKSLYAVENEVVHTLWSKAIENPAIRRGMQKLYETRDANESSVVAELAKSLREPASSGLATVYLEYTRNITEKFTERICRDIHRLLEHDRNSIRELLSGRKASSANTHELQDLLSKLAACSRSGFLSTRIMSLKAICTLAIEDPYVRRTLKDCEDILRHLEKMTGSSRTEIRQWASGTLDVIENDEVNKLWSSFLSGSSNTSDQIQRLSNGVATSDDQVFSALSKSLRDSRSAFPANLYLELAAKLVGHGASRHDDYLMDKPSDSARDQSQLQRKMCSECNQEHPEYLSSSEDLLKYVLDSAPKDSLPNLTGILPSPEGLGGTIGEGGFSEVHAISTKIKGKDVAIKLLKVEFEGAVHCKGRFVVRNFARELRILSRINHPNVLDFLGYALWEISGKKQYYIVSEWMRRGDLKNCIIRGLTMLGSFEMSLGITKGLCYLHEKKIVHGDIKSPNVLVSSSGEPILADFGLAKMAESLWSKGYYSTVTVRASLRWVPCEYYFVDDEKTYRPNQKSDVWSFGMTLLELLTRDVPFAHIKNDGGVSTAIIRGRPPVEEIPTYGDNDHDRYLKRDLWSLCGKCLVLKQGARPSMEECLRELIRMKYRHSVGLDA